VLRGRILEPRRFRRYRQVRPDDVLAETDAVMVARGDLGVAPSRGSVRAAPRPSSDRPELYDQERGILDDL
jgi:hypothetical protein